MVGIILINNYICLFNLLKATPNTIYVDIKYKILHILNQHIDTPLTYLSLVANLTINRVLSEFIM